MPRRVLASLTGYSLGHIMKMEKGLFPVSEKMAAAIKLLTLKLEPVKP
jgi:hypothetical protein